MLACVILQVADLGLTRGVHGRDRQYYSMQTERPLPLRWIAPEAIQTLTWTTASDIWAYGVTLWEVYTFGALLGPSLWDAVRPQSGSP